MSAILCSAILTPQCSLPRNQILLTKNDHLGPKFCEAKYDFAARMPCFALNRRDFDHYFKSNKIKVRSVDNVVADVKFFFGPLLCVRGEFARISLVERQTNNIEL